jgi:protein-glutamine gamma-glutamyltransferase
VASWRAWMRRVTTISPRELLRLSFSWRGGLAAATLCALVFLVIHVGRHTGVAWRLFGRRTPPDPSRVRREPVAFYQRFEAILARRGLHRARSQTQLAFARQAAALLVASPQHADTADLPERIAEAFYRFRYGRWSPTTEQTDTLNAWLARLEQAVSPPAT